MTLVRQSSGGCYGGDENTVYLSPAPLYHSAPLGFNTGFLSLGGTSIVMEKFDPEAALKAIQDYKVTHSQWVPTMFVRFLKTDESLRSLITYLRTRLQFMQPLHAPLK
ncbi:MAG: hypothetical protein CM1200mP12_17020 [Gammaproteobacteria bacterium]|nr:MAG: hypothetical protein CM1200mP12_17020 [Gammaproteobacteria bacterium]